MNNLIQKMSFSVFLTFLFIPVFATQNSNSTPPREIDKVVRIEDSHREIDKVVLTEEWEKTLNNNNKRKTNENSNENSKNIEKNRSLPKRIRTRAEVSIIENNQIDKKSSDKHSLKFILQDKYLDDEIDLEDGSSTDDSVIE